MKLPEKHLAEAVVARNQPCLCLIEPRLMESCQYSNQHRVGGEGDFFGQSKLTAAFRYETHFRILMTPMEAGLRCAETSVRASNSRRLLA